MCQQLMDARFEKINKRFDVLETKLDLLNAKFEKSSHKLTNKTISPYELCLKVVNNKRIDLLKSILDYNISSSSSSPLDINSLTIQLLTRDDYEQNNTIQTAIITILSHKISLQLDIEKIFEIASNYSRTYICTYIIEHFPSKIYLDKNE